MEQFIRFRMLANQLDDAEFNQFIAQTIKSHGRDLLLNCLFDHFKSRYQTQPESTIIPSLTDTISQIITKRESLEDESVQLDNITKLPSVLISELASYLKAPEYIVFSVCNRKIYVSCNSPCKIYHMPTCLLKV